MEVVPHVAAPVEELELVVCAEFFEELESITCADSEVLREPSPVDMVELLESEVVALLVARLPPRVLVGGA